MICESTDTGPARAVIVMVQGHIHPTNVTPRGSKLQPAAAPAPATAPPTANLPAQDDEEETARKKEEEAPVAYRVVEQKIIRLADRTGLAAFNMAGLHSDLANSNASPPVAAKAALALDCGLWSKGPGAASTWLPPAPAFSQKHDPVRDNEARQRVRAWLGAVCESASPQSSSRALPLTLVRKKKELEAAKKDDEKARTKKEEEAAKKKKEEEGASKKEEAAKKRREEESACETPQSPDTIGGSKDTSVASRSESVSAESAPAGDAGTNIAPRPHKEDKVSSTSWRLRVGLIKVR